MNKKKKSFHLRKLGLVLMSRVHQLFERPGFNPRSSHTKASKNA